ncbi:MAG: VWA domain-containing protein [Thiobacillus sp.]|uniref:nitric oxide reductase activation protein NorD n=1 Tax=unclassified Thiobacillus TaxID=2646513 RepID=UPI0009669C1D|nr:MULTISPECIES: VWA domain-containing protein [unclassified Thiobacillus]MBN8770210.1 VWA domain-containing protein [Thiobacillus sp.]MBN8780382.1 VWA domain-containing protein [Thiobacillus sp.]OJY55589.1 MAG: nitric oxide reductase activation protein [Thiobacillus sp. 0-1251]
MAQQQLTTAEMEASLHIWLDTEFTYFKVEQLAAELATLTRDEQDFILGWIRRIASTHITLAWQFGRRAPALLSRMERRLLEAWAVHTCDVFDRTGLQTALRVMEEVDSFDAAQHRNDAAGALFDDIAPILGNFVCGLSGRRLRIEEGDAAWTDGERIILPPLIAALPDLDDNFQLAKITVALLWAQTRYGTLRADLTGIATKYADPERALARLYALETLRLSARIARELPGLYRQMQRLRAQLDPGLPPSWQRFEARLAADQATLDDSLALLDAAYEDVDCPQWSDQGCLRPDAIAAARTARLDKEKARLRIKLAELLEEQTAAQPDPQTAAETPPELNVTPRDENGLLDFEITLDDAPIAPPDGVKQLLTSVYLDFGEIPPDYLTPAGDGEYDPNLVFDQPEDPDAVWHGTYHEKGAELYPEWDHGRQHYRKNWCVMREKTVTPAYDDFYRDTLGKHAGVVKHLRRKFEALRDENRIEKRQVQGDEIDLDALIEALADAKDGSEMSDRLFVRLHRAERNIAVAFLVDMSGSTKGWINEAEREALILLCEALELLGDRYAIYGFSGTTRKRCELFRIKTFDERYDDEVKARISGIRPQEYTRMGFALRHMTKLLNQVEAKTRVLVTLSDGRPDDYFDVYRGQYGIEDTRMALLEAARTGIHPFCITLDRDARDYLPHMYGAARYIILDDVRQLPVKVTDIYRRITT